MEEKETKEKQGVETTVKGRKQENGQVCITRQRNKGTKEQRNKEQRKSKRGDERREEGTRKGNGQSNGRFVALSDIGPMWHVIHTHNIS